MTMSKPGPSQAPAAPTGPPWTTRSAIALIVAGVAITVVSAALVLLLQLAPMLMATIVGIVWVVVGSRRLARIHAFHRAHPLTSV